MIDVIVVMGILGFAFLLVLMALPRGRETARMAGCQKNMMQIGVGLQLYHQGQQHYPIVPKLGDSIGESPIKAMLDAMVVPDFTDLKDPSKPLKTGQSPPRGVRVAGLTCPSDFSAMSGTFTTPTSYRFNTGDTPDGLAGPFEVGRTATIAQIEAADGLSYTAGIAERLIGSGHDGEVGLGNYASSPESVDDSGCPDLPLDRWRGDAGSNWAEVGWRSTLYNHSLVPNAVPSCVASDGRTARMGASSSHRDRINVLMMDNSLRGIKPTIDLKIWRTMGTVGIPEAKPTP